MSKLDYTNDDIEYDCVATDDNNFCKICEQELNKFGICECCDVGEYI